MMVEHFTLLTHNSKRNKQNMKKKKKIQVVELRAKMKKTRNNFVSICKLAHKICLLNFDLVYLLLD